MNKKNKRKFNVKIDLVVILVAMASVIALIVHSAWPYITPTPNPDKLSQSVFSYGDEKNLSTFEENVDEAEIAIVPAQPSTAPDAPMADIIMIPEINITAPLVTAPPGTDAAKLKKMLDSGAVVYPDSASFGGVGQTIVLGHSAPPGWPEIKHDTIFSRIAELGFGSKIVAVYNDKTYTYSAVENRIIEKGGDIPKLAGADNVLVLVTCWPPGRDLKRMVVQANLVSVE